MNAERQLTLAKPFWVYSLEQGAEVRQRSGDKTPARSCGSRAEREGAPAFPAPNSDPRVCSGIIPGREPCPRRLVSRRSFSFQSTPGASGPLPKRSLCLGAPGPGEVGVPRRSPVTPRPETGPRQQRPCLCGPDLRSSPDAAACPEAKKKKKKSVSVSFGFLDVDNCEPTTLGWFPGVSACQNSWTSGNAQ